MKSGPPPSHQPYVLLCSEPGAWRRLHIPIKDQAVAGGRAQMSRAKNLMWYRQSDAPVKGVAVCEHLSPVWFAST